MIGYPGYSSNTTMLNKCLQYVTRTLLNLTTVQDIITNVCYCFQVMLGGVEGAGRAAEGEILTVTIVRDEHGYGMKVSGWYHFLSVNEHYENDCLLAVFLANGEEVHRDEMCTLEKAQNF